MNKLEFTDRELEMLYAAIMCLQDNKFMYNFVNIRKKELTNLKEKIRKDYWDEREFGISLLNEKDFK